MGNEAKTNQREKFKIEVQDHEILPAIAKTAYLSSNELCKLVSELFKSVFADFEGCTFEASGQEPTVNLLFNHGKYDEDATVACERLGAKESGSSIIDRTRNRDRQMAEGDRYYLTDDGKDAFTSLLTSRLFNNGNPNWKVIVSEFQDRSVQTMYNYGNLPQYTKVSGISLERLCALIFGSKNESGDHIDYDVKIKAPLSPMGYNPQGMLPNMNYMLTITSVSAAEVSKIYEKLGYGSISANIVR